MVITDTFLLTKVDFSENIKCKQNAKIKLY